MNKHFVTFFSPGTFVAETSELPINKWDVKKAIKMAHKIKERYSATPYAFQFSTRSRGLRDLDSKITKESGYYFLGGEIKTLADLEKDNKPDEEILRSNMKFNEWDKIITNTNSWKWTQPFRKEDVLLDFKVKKS